MALTYFIIDQATLILIIGCIAAALRLGKTSISLMIISVTLLVKYILDAQLLSRLIDLEKQAELAGNELISIWYTSFSLSNLLCLLVIYSAHRATVTPFNLFSRMVIYIFALKVMLILSRCAERLYFSTNILQEAYKLGVPGLNYLLLAVLGYGLFYFYRRQKEFEERIAWST